MACRPAYCLLLAFLLSGCGGGGSSSPAAPAPNPTPSNSTPVAANQSVATDPGTTLTGTLSATDANGDTLSYAVVSQPMNGAVVLSGAGNASFEYQPAAGFAGVETFTFSASDGEDTSTPATVTINVNAKPVATAASYETSEIGVIERLVAASDAENDALTFAVAQAPGKGTLTAFDSATGAFTYMPDAAENGADSFTFTASDGFQESVAGSVDIEIFRWGPDKQFGTMAEDFATTGGIVGTPDGGTIFGGATKGPVDGIANAGENDAWLKKFDRLGNEVWTYRVGTADSDLFRSVLGDIGGNGVYGVLIASSGAGISASDPGTATVYRVDDNGNLLWSSPIGAGVDPYYPGYWSLLGDDGDLYVVVWIDEIAASQLVRLDGTDGSEIFRVTFDSSVRNAADPFINDSERVFLRGLDMDSNGNVILVGSFWDNGARSCGINCSFIASVDDTGSLLWTREVTDITTACGTSTELRFFRVTVTADGSLAVTGLTDPLSGSSNGLLVSYNANATAQNFSYCADEGLDAVDIFTPAFANADGEVVVYATISREDDPTTSLPVTDLLVVKLDASGNVVFRRELPATRNDGTGAEQFTGSVYEDAQGVIYLSGWIAGELFPGAAIGDDDVFYRRLDRDGNVR